MQFSAIRTYCATRFRDQGNTIVTDADWKNYVNTAYGDVLIAMPYGPWLEQASDLTVLAGARSVSLPTDVWRVSSVWDKTNQFPLVPLEGRAQVYNEYPQQIETGQAMHYRIFNNLLEVYPLPQTDTVYTVEYFLHPADLNGDADVPVFPQQYHDMLVSGAVALAYRDDGNLQQAQVYDAEYQGMLAALKIEAAQPRQDRYYEPIDTFM